MSAEPGHGTPYNAHNTTPIATHSKPTHVEHVNGVAVTVMADHQQLQSVHVTFAVVTHRVVQLHAVRVEVGPRVALQRQSHNHSVRRL